VIAIAHEQLGLRATSRIRSFNQDARMFLADRANQTQYDIIYGDAFNDLSVPWHLTTLEFARAVKSQMAPDGVFIKTSTHPRAYGNFARLLGKYVRDEHVIPMEEAIRKLTSLPAATLRLKERGRLEKGYFADVVVFDPKTIGDRSTYEKPHQYATGVKHVWVNGGHVLKDGEHTGQKPGQVVRGPGYTLKVRS
jgi:hypothetical protein